MSVATPLEFKLALPREAVPLRKLTVPAGATPLAGVTVAVSVKVWPAVRLDAEAVRAVVVAMREPVTVTMIGGAEVEAASVVEPG
jgi:hypothetical protein